MRSTTSRALTALGGAAAAVTASCAPALADESIRSHFVGFSGGLLMSIIAFSIVFLVVCGLMIMMMLLKTFVATINAGGSKPAPASAPAPKAAPASSTAQSPAPAAAVSAPDDEAEVIAAITAAIAAMIDGPAHIASIAPAAPTTHHRPYAGSTSWRMSGILSNSSGLGD